MLGRGPLSKAISFRNHYLGLRFMEVNQDDFCSKNQSNPTRLHLELSKEVFPFSNQYTEVDSQSLNLVKRHTGRKF